MSKTQDMVIPEGWVIENFLNVFDALPTKQYQILNTDISDVGVYKVVDQGNNKIAGYNDNASKVFKKTPVIIFGDHTTILKYINFNFIVGADGTKILKNKTGNLKFLYFNLEFNKIHSEGYKRHYSILQEINLLLPQSLKEQDKIAEILSTLDETIENTDRLIEKYKKIKAGLMEDLFTRGIDINTGKPHTKFKDSELGTIPESWEAFKMKDLNILMTNGFVGVASPYYVENGGVNYLFGNNVRKNKIELNNVIKISNNFNKIHLKSQLKYGDMLTVQSGHIGTSAIVPINFKEANCHALIITRFKKDIVNPFYISYYCNSELGMNRMASIFVGSTIKHVNVKEFQNYIVPLCSIKEQDKITEILMEADNKVEREEAYREKLEKIKKGLMNDLLTGKVRVKF